MKHHPSATPSLRKKKRVVSLLGGPTRKFDDDDDDDDDEKMCLFAKEKGNEELLRSMYCIFGFTTKKKMTRSSKRVAQNSIVEKSVRTRCPSP